MRRLLRCEQQLLPRPPGERFTGGRRMSGIGYANRNASSWISGLCGCPTNPPGSHALCSGTDGERACGCECHKGEPLLPETITHPTIIYDLADADYHGHKGSLSASRAKLLAPPIACPAKFRWAQDNPETKDAFDFGHVAHRLVLGKGADIEVIRREVKNRKGELLRVEDAADLKSDSAKEHEEAIRKAGKTPILAKDYERAKAVAKAVADDPLAGPLFTDGQAEVSLFWPDAETGIVRRARFDWLKNKVDGKRRIIADLKTARSAEPYTFGRSAADFGYAISAANYVDGAIACGLDDDPLFIFAAVEKTPPYVVSTFYATEDVIELGRALMRKALRTYAECVNSGKWPGYAEGPMPLELPAYYLKQTEENL